MSRVRTGYEKVVAHYSTDIFSYAADRNGVIEDIDNDLKIVKIRYDNDKIDAKHKLTINMSDEDFTYRTKKNIPIFLINYGTALDKYKLEELVEIRNMPFRIVERLSYQTIEEIPDIGVDIVDLDALKKQNTSNKPYTVLQLMPPAYEESNIDIIQFGTRFSLISGSYLKQTIVLNAEKGDRIKKGDIVAYNSGFFEPDPYSKQVSWKHGVMATIAILESDDTLEDSNGISKELSKKLSMSAAHNQTVMITSKTVIHDIVKVGQHVQSTDPLCMIEASDIDILSSGGDENMTELMSSLNKKQPKAKNAGVIADIDVFYSCPLSEMHPSIVDLVKKIDNHKAKLSNAASNTRKKNNFAPPGKTPVNTKYAGVAFDKDTILITFMIAEDIDCGIGDKLVYITSLKSIVANVMEKATRTVSGLVVDAHFSAKSIRNRIINSPWIIGITNRILMKMEDFVIERYFKNKK